MLEKIISFIKNLFSSKKVVKKIENNNSPNSINAIDSNITINKKILPTYDEKNESLIF